MEKREKVISGYREQLYRFDIVEATFNPTITDDLKPNGDKWIGFRGYWLVSSNIDEGIYKGQLSFDLMDGRSSRDRVDFLWVPEEDLTIHRIATLEDYKAFWNKFDIKNNDEMLEAVKNNQA